MSLVYSSLEIGLFLRLCFASFAEMMLLMLWHCCRGKLSPQSPVAPNGREEPGIVDLRG